MRRSIRNTAPALSMRFSDFAEDSRSFAAKLCVNTDEVFGTHNG